jgi:peptide/nickel transport system ATP-binding protein
MSSEPLLRIENLEVHFDTDDGIVKAVDGLSLEVEPGKVLGIVGESGSGKSVANMTILGLTRADNARISGRILFEGRDLVPMQGEELREIRGNQISMIFQDPLSSLHPFYKVGKQLVEAIQVHRPVDKDAAWKRAVELLELVGIPDAKRRSKEYPHEFSGGMRQRAMIAMALTNDPKLLIADEPTTALDVTTQAQILKLIAGLQEEFGMAVIIITHDLGVVADMADDLTVMYAGRAIESGTVEQVFYDPQHPYTWGLLGSLTRIDRPHTARLAQIAGQPPSLISLPEGCAFRNRCAHAFGRCTQTPALEQRSTVVGHLDRCWLTPEQKKTLRVLASGEIGLREPAK